MIRHACAPDVYEKLFLRIASAYYYFSSELPNEVHNQSKTELKTVSEYEKKNWCMVNRRGK